MRGGARDSRGGVQSFGGEEETAGYQRRRIKKEAEEGGRKQAVVAFAVKRKVSTAKHKKNVLFPAEDFCTLTIFAHA